MDEELQNSHDNSEKLYKMYFKKEEDIMKNNRNPSTEVGRDSVPFAVGPRRPLRKPPGKPQSPSSPAKPARNRPAQPPRPTKPTNK